MRSRRVRTSLPESPPDATRGLRRVVAVLATIALSAGLAVVGVAAPASAHHNTISGVGACNASTGLYDITWSVTNSESNKTEEIVKSSNEAVVPVGTALGKSETKKFVQRGVVAGTYKLELTAYWASGNVTKTNSEKSAVVVSGECDPVKKISFCHATGSEKNPYVRVETSVSAFFNAGHIDHQGQRDIYPAFRYSKQGKDVLVAAQGDQSLLADPDCGAPANNWEYGAPTCEALLVTYPTGVNENDVNVRLLDASGTPFTLNFHGAETWTGTQTFTFATHEDWPNPRSWTVVWVQVGGTNYHWEGSVTCGTPDVEIATPSATFTDACGVDNFVLTYDENLTGVVWDTSRDGDTISLTATPATGYTFASGTDAVEIGTWKLNQEPCPIEIPKPVKPSFHDECGVANDGIDLPADTATVTWTKTAVVDGTAKAIARAADGHVFPNGKTVKRFTFKNFTDVPCPDEVPVPVNPGVGDGDVCGTENDVVRVPESDEAVTWTATEIVDGTATLTATANDGYVFTDDTRVTTFTIEFTDVPCPTPVAVTDEPTAVELCGTDGDAVVLPAAHDGILWEIEGVPADGTVLVTAHLDEGYIWTDETVDPKTFELTFDATACVEPVLTGSVATGECVANAPWIFFDVELTDPDEQSTTHDVELILSDGTNTETLALGTLVDGTLSGKTLWPGASVASDGVTPTGWPGWEQLADGTWQPTEGNFAWSRTVTSAVLKVNPEITVDLVYPPATPDCVAAPPVTETPAPAPPTDGGGDGGVPLANTGGGEGTTPTATDASPLAETGFNGGMFAVIAGLLLAAGAAVLVVLGLRRKRRNGEGTSAS